MTTKAQLQNTIDTYAAAANKHFADYQREKARADKLQAALDSKFEELEKRDEKMNWAQQCNMYDRNLKRRNVVEAAFRQIIDWAGRNMGYTQTEDELMANDEREATGLGGLVYLETINPDWAIRFAAEVCEQHNYHGECASLMALYDKVTQPYANSRQDATTVNWWAD